MDTLPACFGDVIKTHHAPHMPATGSDDEFSLAAHPKLAKELPVCVAILDGYGMRAEAHTLTLPNTGVLKEQCSCPYGRRERVQRSVQCRALSEHARV